MRCTKLEKYSRLNPGAGSPLNPAARRGYGCARSSDPPPRPRTKSWPSPHTPSKGHSLHLIPDLPGPRCKPAEGNAAARCQRHRLNELSICPKPVRWPARPQDKLRTQRLRGSGVSPAQAPLPTSPCSRQPSASTNPLHVSHLARPETSTTTRPTETNSAAGQAEGTGYDVGENNRPRLIRIRQAVDRSVPGAGRTNCPSARESRSTGRRTLSTSPRR